jgi:hypothetical protein
MRDAFFRRLRTLRDGNPHYFTNAYILSPALHGILNADGTEVTDAADATAVCYSDNGVRRALLFARDARAAAALFGVLRGDRQIILEIIAGEREIDGLTELFTKSGWKHYERLFRMSCPNISPQGYASAEVELATPKDLKVLHAMLHGMFDANISHLPDERRLLDCIERSEVAVIRDGDEIAAVNVAQKTGERTRYFYQGAVLPTYHGRKYIQSIYDFQYASYPKGTVVSLWVVESNETIIHIHKKYGHRPDANRHLEIFSIK